MHQGHGFTYLGAINVSDDLGCLELWLDQACPTILSWACYINLA